MENQINRKISRLFPISFGSSCRFSTVIQHSIVNTRRPKRSSSSPRIRESIKIVPEFRTGTSFISDEDSKHQTPPYPHPGNDTLFSLSSDCSDSSCLINRRNPKTIQNPSSSITHNGSRNEIRGSGGGGRGVSRRWEVAAAGGRKIEEESYVVAKRSRDPHRDFRESMVEMIVEKKIRGAEDLEKLLESFLRLNDSYHHHVILHAFSDICEALFSFP